MNEDEHAPQPRPAAGVAGCIYIICLRRKTERLARFSCVLHADSFERIKTFRIQKSKLSNIILLTHNIRFSICFFQMRRIQYLKSSISCISIELHSWRPSIEARLGQELTRPALNDIRDDS